MSEVIYPKIPVTEEEIMKYNNKLIDGRNKINSARINEINAKKEELKKLRTGTTVLETEKCV